MFAVVINNFPEILAMGTCLAVGIWVGRKTAGWKLPSFKRA